MLFGVKIKHWPSVWMMNTKAFPGQVTVAGQQDWHFGDCAQGAASLLPLLICKTDPWWDSSRCCCYCECPRATWNHSARQVPCQLAKPHWLPVHWAAGFHADGESLFRLLWHFFEQTSSRAAGELDLHFEFFLPSFQLCHSAFDWSACKHLVIKLATVSTAL